MSITMQAEEGQAKLDPGTYEVTCMNVTEDQLEKPQFGDGHVIRIELETVDVVDEYGNPVKLDTIANQKLSPKSKLWGICEAFGLAPELGKSLELEDMINQHAFAVVGAREGADGTVFARVESLVPMPKKGQPRPSQAPTGTPSASFRERIVLQTPRGLTGDGTTESEQAISDFWRRIFAHQLTRADVVPYVNGDLSTLPRMSVRELAKVLKDMGVPEEEEE